MAAGVCGGERSTEQRERERERERAKSIQRGSADGASQNAAENRNWILYSVFLWEGYHESRRCSRDTYPESYITKYTSIQRDMVTWCRISGTDGTL